MVTPFSGLLSKASTFARPRPRTPQDPLVVPVPPRPAAFTKGPEEPAPISGRGLRCFWYDDALTDTLTAAHEFLCTPAAIAALAEFYRAWHASRAPESDARALIDAFCSAAARVCGEDALLQGQPVDPAISKPALTEAARRRGISAVASKTLIRSCEASRITAALS